MAIQSPNTCWEATVRSAGSLSYLLRRELLRASEACCANKLLHCWAALKTASSVRAQSASPVVPAHAREEVGGEKGLLAQRIQGWEVGA